METNPFGDFRPKLTPDTIFDYKYSIKDKILLLKIPSNPQLSDLPFIIQLLKQAQKSAKKHPGCFTPGNMVLGARPEEYNPSDEELIESYLGDIIVQILSTSSVQELSPFQSILKSIPTYRKISISHMDCMGSGRFFYADPPIETKIT